MTWVPHRTLTVAAAFGLTIAARAAAAPVTFPYPVHERTLDNGLRVYVVPMDASPGVVGFSTWMSVGSRDEVEPGRTGFAHFFEHLMFHGTPTVSADQRDRQLLRLGAEDNAWTWFDETVYHTAIPAASLPALAALEADRFQHLKLEPDPLRREAGAVYGEYRKGRADPASVLGERLYATAFRVHPYGHDTIGLEADIAAMPEQYEAALAFFDRYYRPDHAAVLVVGDVEPEATFALVRDTYGAWTTGPAAPLPVPPEPAQTETRRVTVDWPTEAAPLLTMGWRIGAHDADDPSIAALELAADLLLSPTGPLERRLVRDEPLAYAIGGGRLAMVDPGLLTIEVEARHAADLPRIEAIVREEVAKLGAEVDPAALDALRTRRTYRYLSSLDDPMTVLEVVGTSLRRDPDPAALDRWQAALAAVTPAQVSAAVQQALVDRSLTVATLIPPAEAE
ncbi:MAG: pitrilysin family protein [Myxococcota bacterium]